MEETQICPWCMTEIVWDEEIGPESVCPHCENELSGYRSVNIGLDGDNDEDDLEQEGDEESYAQENGDEDLWGESEDAVRGGGLAVEAIAQQVMEQQLEAPECPVCREYMLEAGEQQIGGEGFKAYVPPALGQSLVPVPFNVTWYVCPSCFHVSSQLSLNDREELASRLRSADSEE